MGLSRDGQPVPRSRKRAERDGFDRRIFTEHVEQTP
jgi:hypothetical protein